VFISHKPPQRYPRFPYRGLVVIEDRPQYVIGRSMTEVDSITAEWKDRSRDVDEIWLPSEHSLQAFQAAGVTKSKLFLVHEPLDISLYQTTIPPLEIPTPESFNFLSVFKFEDRKNWQSLVLAFFQEFSAYEDVHLYIHTYLFGEMDAHSESSIRRRIERFLDDKLELEGRDLKTRPLPWNNLHILADELPTSAMPALYRAMNAFILPTHGEGWGLPIIEAMAMELPVVVTGWSGPLEFCHPGNSILLPLAGFESASGTDFHPSQKWAVPTLSSIRWAMRELVRRPNWGKALGKRARIEVLARFSRSVIANQILNRLKEVQKSLVAKKQKEQKAEEAEAERAADAKAKSNPAPPPPPAVASPRVVNAAQVRNAPVKPADTKLVLDSEPLVDPIDQFQAQNGEDEDLKQQPQVINSDPLFNLNQASVVKRKGKINTNANAKAPSNNRRSGQ
jgi:glycosyltransferase involved in cell wall biosynthesis